MSQVAILVVSVKKKYMHQDIVGDFEKIQSFMDVHKMTAELALALQRIHYGVQKHHMKNPKAPPTITNYFQRCG